MQAPRKRLLGFQRTKKGFACSWVMLALVRALKVTKMGAQLSLGSPWTRWRLM